jgi:hypothetical protein
MSISYERYCPNRWHAAEGKHLRGAYHSPAKRWKQSGRDTEVKVAKIKHVELYRIKFRTAPRGRRDIFHLSTKHMSDHDVSTDK